jgi:hypothetical protein
VKISRTLGLGKTYISKARTNGGVQCDMDSGPCACGAWHNPESSLVTERSSERKKNAMTTKEAVDQVLAGFQHLILSGRTLLGQEQYAPRGNADQSEEAMADYRKQVRALRAMREQFETLMTGGLE